MFGPGPPPLTVTLSPHVLCRACGLPILEAATACRARAAALCSALTRSPFTHHPRLFSCSLQVRSLCHSAWPISPGVSHPLFFWLCSRSLRAVHRLPSPCICGRRSVSVESNGSLPFPKYLTSLCLHVFPSLCHGLCFDTDLSLCLYTLT